MATNWIVLGGNDLKKVVQIKVISKANQNTGTDAQEGQNVNLDEANRANDLVALAVAEFRAAVRVCGKVPYSVTPEAVSPGSARHVLNIAAWQLINSTPSLDMVVIGDKPTFLEFYKQAMTYLDGIRNGDAVVEPTDPVGQDWTTAVSEDNPAIAGAVTWGDLTATDLEYAQGHTTETDRDPEIELPADDLRTH